MFLIATPTLKTRTAKSNVWPNRYAGIIRRGVAAAPNMFLIYDAS